ncbi:uncharacterized protein [Centruroides vittatus]|uniref:uncharacterized protein isoform X1 n=1 Tax=Centruroides vittatus TaxID=120091 RepID=UPI00350EA866
MSTIYEKVLESERVGNTLNNEDIEEAVQNIRDIYKNIRNTRCLPAINYNESRFRCAYVYYFAGCHTSSLVSELSKFSYQHNNKYQEMMLYCRSSLNVCSLGGGPGCDLVGLLYARYFSGGIVYTSEIRCTVVDLFGGWGESLEHVRQSFLNTIGSVYQKMKVFEFNLLESNLCNPQVEPGVKKAIREAHIITMVKFVSIIPSKKYENMKCLKRIFTFMKRRSFIIYLDNLQGDLYDKVVEEAENCGLNMIWRSQSYRSPEEEKIVFSSNTLKVKALKQTAIDVVVWQKT